MGLIGSVLFIIGLYVLFFGGLSSHSYRDVTITGQGLQILTYPRHSRPLSSEGSLAYPPIVTWGIRL